MNAPRTPLVLEIVREEGRLSMGIHEQEPVASTIRHYSQRQVDFAGIDKLCRDVVSILSHTTKNKAVAHAADDSLRKSGQLLWDHLLTKPAKEQLGEATPGDLILFLDEELINIPWELLHDGRDFLSLKFNVGRLVRSRRQAYTPRYRSAASVLKMLILANPGNDLESAYLEGLHIKNKFDRHRKQIRIDFKSTNVDTLFVKKNLRDYDIVHFAGHCEYDEVEHKNSGWILSDGKFTAEDILELGEGTPLPGLVFSNACQSAKVAPDSLDPAYQKKSYSLASAFLFSGARHYIGAIRKIEDTVSLVFAEAFYSHLLKGSSVGECVRQGRLKLIKEFGIATLPWSSYLLYGDPTHALFREAQKARHHALPLGKRIKGYKRVLIKLGLLGFVIGICTVLYMRLPTSDPRTYLAFGKAHKLFSQGKNQEVVDAATRITKDDPLFLSAYPLLADAYQRLGRLDEALKAYFEYALHSEKRHDNTHLARAFTGIGWLYQAKGEYKKAFDFYTKAIALSRKYKDKFNEAAAMRKLAVWHIDKDEYDLALELLMKCSEINRDRSFLSGHRYNLACDYFDIGLVFENKDDAPSAKEFYQKSFTLFKQLKLKNELSDYYFNLGEIYLFEKEYQKARECYASGLKIDQAQGNLPSLVADYEMLGELYAEMGSTREAEDSFLESISLGEKIQAPQELASAYYNLGLLYKRKGQTNKAREYLRQAQEIYRTINLPLYQKIKEEFQELNNAS